MVESLKKKGIEPRICLWYWTNPVWLEKKGGSLEPYFLSFERFAEKVVDSLGDKIKLWLTVNEPSAVAAYSCLVGFRSPQKKNPFMALEVLRIIATAYKRAYRRIHQKTKTSSRTLRFFEIYGIPSRKIPS